jgi:hypothetical protein
LVSKRTKQVIAKLTQPGFAALALLMFASAPCAAFAGPKASGSTTTDSSSAASGDYMGLSGEELWSNNCLRCHNIRPPTMYSDAQWDVIVHHMRLRANITGQEQRAIVEFLKSAK